MTTLTLPEGTEGLPTEIRVQRADGSYEPLDAILRERDAERARADAAERVLQSRLTTAWARAHAAERVLRELEDALQAEAKAKMKADNALENFTSPEVEIDAYQSAIIRLTNASAAARAHIAAIDATRKENPHD